MAYLLVCVGFVLGLVGPVLAGSKRDCRLACTDAVAACVTGCGLYGLAEKQCAKAVLKRCKGLGPAACATTTTTTTSTTTTTTLSPFPLTLRVAAAGGGLDFYLTAVGNPAFPVDPADFRMMLPFLGNLTVPTADGSTCESAAMPACGGEIRCRLFWRYDLAPDFTFPTAASAQVWFDNGDWRAVTPYP